MLLVGQQTLNRLGWSLGLSVGVFKAERAQAAGQLGLGGGDGGMELGSLPRYLHLYSHYHPRVEAINCPTAS